MRKLRYVSLANRSACFLKLGQPEKALEDARKSVEIEPTYCKACFRYGLSLHALERYAIDPRSIAVIPAETLIIAKIHGEEEA